MFAMIVALSLTPSTGGEPSIVWSDVEPLLRSRFAIVAVDKHFWWTSQAPLQRSGAPRQARVAVRDLTSYNHEEGVQVLQRIALDLDMATEQSEREDPLGGDLAADSQRFRNALFSDERTVRVLRNGLARLLERRGIACADCAVTVEAPRTVTFADFVPYLSRFIVVAPGDLSAADGREHFTLCSGTNGLGQLERVDVALASTALAAMYRAAVGPGIETPAIEQARTVLRSVREKHPGEESPELRDAINAAVARRLAEDAIFLGSLRPLVAEEAKESGFACSDCGSSTTR